MGGPIEQHLLPLKISWENWGGATRRKKLPANLPETLMLNPSWLRDGHATRQDVSSVQFSSVAQSCLTLCDTMICSTPGLPVHHQLPDFTQTHVHRVGDAIQPSHPLLSPSPPAPNPSQHQSLFQWVSSSNQVASSQTKCGNKQDDWPETTWKLTLLPLNLRL